MADYRYFAYGQANNRRSSVRRWALIAETDDYDSAAEIANRWDERRDVYFFDRRHMTFQDFQQVADIKFDNAIARLSR